ncbi:MAG: hypothetical protein WEA61_01755 [Anaerolineales bacterium]
MSRKTPANPFELKLNYLLPAFFALGAIVNLGITRSPVLSLEGYAQVSIHPSIFADYSQDSLDLSFPPLDPDIMDDANHEAPPQQEDTPADAIPTTDPALPTATLPLPTVTPTEVVTIPTLPGPTLTPLPTLPPILPTLPPILDTAVSPLIDTVIPSILDTATPVIEGLVPTCLLLIPCP